MKEVFVYFLCLLCLILFSVSIACSSQSDTLVSKDSDVSFIDQFNQGILVAVKEDPQTTGSNTLGIYNAYDKEQIFNIEPCQFCTFENLSATVPAKTVKTVVFTSKNAGQKTIVIRDKLNNYYAKTSFTVES